MTRKLMMCMLIVVLSGSGLSHAHALSNAPAQIIADTSASALTKDGPGKSKKYKKKMSKQMKKRKRR